MHAAAVELVGTLTLKILNMENTKKFTESLGINWIRSLAGEPATAGYSVHLVQATSVKLQAPSSKRQASSAESVKPQATSVKPQA